MPRLYVATNGLSVWSSDDLGETIGRMPSGTGLYSGSQVWSLTHHPDRPGELFAGTDTGVYRLDCAKKRWHHLPSPMDDLLVTALAQSPRDPSIIVAGTQPAGLFRSEDAGASWRKLDVPMQPYVASGFYQGDAQKAVEQAPVKHWARVTGIAFDPRDATLAWAGVEIDGVWRSADGGVTWSRVKQGLVTDDIHGFAATRSGASVIYVTTCDGLHESRDGGVSWRLRPIVSPWQYTRSIAERTDDTGILFLTNGNGPPGTDGKLFCSRDHGEQWEEVPLPGEIESSLYFLATHPADPMLIFAAANLGQIFRSHDGGETWTVLKRRLGEIRAIAWLPD